MSGAVKERLRDAVTAAWNEGAFARLDALLDPSYERQSYRSAMGRDPEGLKRLINEVRAAFPDLVLTVGDMTHEGDRVVWQWNVRGTHQAPLFDLPPTHRSVEVAGLTTSTFRGDRVVHDWVTSDAEDMLALQGVFQLGQAAAPAGGPVRQEGLDSLKAVHRTFGTGVTIVTAAVHGEPRGLVLNAFASVSLEPPLVLVAVNRTTATHEFLFRGHEFAVNILAADQVELAQRFSRPIPDKFAGVDWHPGANAAPIIDGAAACVEASVQERMSFATHTVFLGRVESARVSGKAPLLYLAGRYHDAGALLGAPEA